MKKGFIRIPRCMFDTLIWNQRRIYSDSDAFLDLYQSADDNDEIETSTRELALRWRWANARVFRFVKRLVDDGFILSKKTKSGTIIRIVNFGEIVAQKDVKWNTSETPNETPNETLLSLFTKGFSKVSETPSETPNETQVKHLSREYKNDNIIISCLKDKNNNIPPLLSPKGEALSKKEKQNKFKKPTIQEIEDYIREKNYRFDAENFWNFYESKGWMVGKNHMKNWRACCATWAKRESSYKNTKHNETILTDNSEEKYLKMETW